MALAADKTTTRAVAALGRAARERPEKQSRHDIMDRWQKAATVVANGSDGGEQWWRWWRTAAAVVANGGDGGKRRRQRRTAAAGVENDGDSGERRRRWRTTAVVMNGTDGGGGNGGRGIWSELYERDEGRQINGDQRDGARWGRWGEMGDDWQNFASYKYPNLPAVLGRRSKRMITQNWKIPNPNIS